MEHDPLLTMSALNMAIVSLHRITSSGDRLILDREYDSIINNLKFEEINAAPQLIQLYQEMLKVIHSGRLRDEIRAEISRADSENKRKSIGEIISGNVLKTFSANPLEWLGDLAMSSASEYFEQQKNLTRNNDDEHLRLKHDELNGYNRLQVNLLSVSSSLLNQYHLPGNYILTQKTLEKFSKALNVSDSAQRVRMFRMLESGFTMYAPYWFHRAISSHEAGNDDESGRCFAKFAEVWQPVLRKDPYMAESMKYKIEGLMRSGVNHDSKGEILKCLDVMRANTPIEDWANNIYMAMIYFTLGEKEKAEELVMCNIDFRFETENSERLLASFEEEQQTHIEQPKPTEPPMPKSVSTNDAQPENDSPAEADSAPVKHAEPSDTQSDKADELKNFAYLVFPVVLVLIILIVNGVFSPNQGKNTPSSPPPPKQEEITDAEAQYKMGEKYYYGWEVKHDYSEAAKWYLKAANQGHASAQFSLGLMYDYGRGVPQSDTEAVKYYRLSAEQNNAMGQNNLGWMYRYGRGVPQSDTEAVKYYRLSAEQNNAQGQNNLGVMYQYGRGVPQSDTEAVKYYRLSAEQNNADAQCNLGWMYDYGRGVPQSDTEAVKYYRLSAEQNNAYAQCNLGFMYKDGKGVPQSDPEAVKWFSKSAAQGHARAQNKLGDMYRYGRGVPKNLTEAVKLYKLAAKQGNTDAQTSLKELNETWQ